MNFLVEYEVEYEKATKNDEKNVAYKKMDKVYKERLKFEYMQDSIDYLLRIRFGQFDLDIKNGLIIK